MTDYDSPWKNVLERFFPDFLAFFFPVAHAGIDGSRGYTLLDKELQKVVPGIVSVYRLGAGPARGAGRPVVGRDAAVRGGKADAVCEQF